MAAAIRLLDREGLAALSMRRLADELGAGAASLYWHVGSKDGLLDLVLDEIIGEGQVPDPDPSRWREQLKEVARAQRRASLRHPYLVRITIGRIPMGPNALRYSERVLAILRAGGLSPRLAVQGYLLLIATVNGFTVDETGVEDGTDGSAPRTDPASHQEAANMARDYIASLPADVFPHLTGLADEFAFSDADERFELLIDIFVDGLARRAAASLGARRRARRHPPHHARRSGVDAPERKLVHDGEGPGAKPEHRHRDGGGCHRRQPCPAWQPGHQPAAEQRDGADGGNVEPGELQGRAERIGRPGVGRIQPPHAEPRRGQGQRHGQVAAGVRGSLIVGSAQPHPPGGDPRERRQPEHQHRHGQDQVGPAPAARGAGRTCRRGRRPAAGSRRT